MGEMAVIRGALLFLSCIAAATAASPFVNLDPNHGFAPSGSVGTSEENAATFHAEPAKPCNPNTCQLPDCFCSGTRVPKDLAPESIPQFVMLTFDDSINPNVNK